MAATRRQPPESLTTEERLRLFVKRADQLESRRYVVSSRKSSIGMRFDLKCGTVKHRDSTDEDDLRSFLMDFRLFMSKREFVFLNRVFNDCDRLLPDKSIREQLRKARRDWRSILSGKTGHRMTVLGRKLTPEYVLDLWINGKYFHSTDQAKATELDHLMRHGFRLPRWQLLLALRDLFHIILYVRDVVRDALEDDLFQFPNTVV